MSISSEELNYLIWRYLQESGKEVAALALQEESRVLEFESKFGEHIPIGTLVNFMQKGILYAESELLVRYDRESTPVDPKRNAQDFNLVQALEIDKEKVPELEGVQRFSLDDNSVKSSTEYLNNDSSNSSSGDDSGKFIKTLCRSIQLPQSFVCQWNPKDKNILAWGGPNSTSTVVTFQDVDGTFSIQHEVTCQHPTAINVADASSSCDVTCLEWSPKGDSFLTGVESGEIRLWTHDAKLQNAFDFHKSSIVTIKWNSDATHFLTYDVDNVAIVWNAQTGTALQQFSFRENGTVDSLGVDASWIGPDKFVIPGPQGSIYICGMGESRPLGKLNGHSATITAFDFNSENNMLLSGSDDKTLRVWRSGSLSSSNCFMGNTLGITSAFWIDDDKVIATSLDGSVRLWSHLTNTLQAISMVDGVPIFCGSLSPDKLKFAIGKMDGEVTVYNIEKLLATLKSIADVGNSPISIPIYGDYQSNIEGNYVNNIAWDVESSHISTSYSSSETALIYVG